MRTLYFSLEEILEINKLAQKEALSKGNDFDELYYTKQQILEQHKDKENEEQDDTSETPPEPENDSGGSENSDDELDNDTSSIDGEETSGAEENKEPDSDEDTEKEPEKENKEIATENFKIRHYLRYKSALEKLQKTLMVGFAVEDLSVGNIADDLKDSLSTTTASLSKIKTALVEHTRLNYVTMNGFGERIDSARRVILMDERLKKVQEQIIVNTGKDEVTDQEGTEALSKADGELVNASDGVYNNTEFIRRLKIGDSVEFDKNIIIANTFTKDAMSALGNVLSTTVNSIQELLKDPINHKGFRLLLPIFSDFTKKDVEGYKSNYNLSTYAYDKVLPGDIIFISYLYDRDKKSTLDDICESEGLFGIDKRLAANVKFCNLLNDKDRASQYIDQLATLIKTNKETLKAVYDFAQDKLGVIVLELSKLAIAVKKDDRKQIKEINVDKLLTMIDYLNRYVLTTIVLIGDYISRVVEASLDFLRESYTEK